MTASILIIIVIIIGVIIIFYLFELFEVIQTNWFPCSKKLIQEKLWSTYSLNAKKIFRHKLSIIGSIFTSFSREIGVGSSYLNGIFDLNAPSGVRNFIVKILVLLIYKNCEHIPIAITKY